MEKYSEDGKILIKGPSDVTSYSVKQGTEIIANEAFEDNLTLKEIFLPEEISSIYEKAFKNCTSLSKVNFPQSLSHLEEEAFYGCENLTKIIFGKSLIYLGKRTFFGCKNIEELVFSEEPAGIEITWNLGTKEIVTIQNGVYTIPFQGFSNCVKLKNLNLPKTLKRIEKEAFMNCEELRIVKIPKEAIVDPDAFKGCPHIQIVKY